MSLCAVLIYQAETPRASLLFWLINSASHPLILHSHALTLSLRGWYLPCFWLTADLSLPPIACPLSLLVWVSVVVIVFFLFLFLCSLPHFFKFPKPHYWSCLIVFVSHFSHHHFSDIFLPLLLSVFCLLPCCFHVFSMSFVPSVSCDFKLLTQHIVSLSSFITGSYDRTCRIWDTASGEELRTLEGHRNVVYAITFNNPYG